MKFNPVIIIISIFIISCQGKQSGAVQYESPDAVDFPEADTLAVNLKKSVITWIGSKPTGQHDGMIDLSEGMVLVSDGEVIGGKITMNIPSIEIMNLEDDPEAKEKLKTHLLSKDFFDTTNYKTGEFFVTGITPFDSSYQIENKVEFPSKFEPEAAANFLVKEANYIVEGNLTLRGTTQGVKFPAKIHNNNGVWSIEAKFNIDRTIWGLSYGDEASLIDKAKDQFIYNTVNTGFYLETLPAPL
ncbi:YceI family protein [Marinoscillum sp. MHG1-6]|uniref:YceI family protein n=1 Tax=Marinoscillum sp. MHG1-6 TaxID=2959627 RepID=UPI002157E957|nr:YceI family protein [Marinoscillum sp. MHG1-6]